MTYNLDLTEGLIPAHAGKTIRDRGRLGLRRAHPRSRGENSHVIRMSPSAFGSSPLTRGKRGGGRRSRRGGRLIPAHAGKTAPGIVFRWSGWAHPRSRGENASSWKRAAKTPGSSPLTRGKPPLPIFDFTGVGLIPAHAGKTAQDPYGRETLAAHPRSRGENPSRERHSPARRGSSPLTRGKHVLDTRVC